MPDDGSGHPAEGGRHQESPAERSDLIAPRGSPAEMALQVVEAVQRRHRAGQRARFVVDPMLLPALVMEVADLAALAAHLLDCSQPDAMPVLEQLRHLGDEAA